LGHNRTGVGTSPNATREMVEGTSLFMPLELSADETEIARVREAYVKDAEPLGTIPPPPNAAGIAKVALEAIKGGRPTQFLDKLGERLAFERTGVRLWEAVISKYQALGGFSGGPDLGALEKIMMDEHQHFRLLTEVITNLGADPTVVTPSADLQATLAKGINEVLVDPRTTVVQCLEAIEVAELADNECWDTLIELARQNTKDGVLTSFVRAREEEARHLANLRSWLAAAQAREPAAS
jgi:hypothetical protein